MFLLETWRRIATSQRTREREAAAQYERVQREGALRDDFARRTQALKAQIAQAHAENCRLRAENRALLNSVLGIAGIPPVIVADPPDLHFVGARQVVPACPARRPGADACLDAAHLATAPPSNSRHSERSVAPSSRSLQRDGQPLFVSTGCLGAQSRRDPSGESGPQDDGAMGDTVAPNGAALPSMFAGRSSATPLQNQAPGASIPHETNAVPPQMQLRRARTAPRPRNDAHAIAPIWRRSWHQIYRMLEFESSRRKANEP